MISKNNQKSIWKVRPCSAHFYSAPRFCCNNMPEFSISHLLSKCNHSVFFFFWLLLLQLDRHFVSKAQRKKKQQKQATTFSGKHLEIEIVRQRALALRFILSVISFDSLDLNGFGQKREFSGRQETKNLAGNAGNVTY